MSNQIEDEIKLVKVNCDEKIVRVYRGRAGCACGCRGTYSNDPKQIELVKQEMGRRMAENPGGFFTFANGVAVEYVTAADREMCLAIYFE
jgi:hypothetical protein